MNVDLIPDYDPPEFPECSHFSTLDYFGRCPDCLAALEAEAAAKWFTKTATN